MEAALAQDRLDFNADFRAGFLNMQQHLSAFTLKVFLKLSRSSLTKIRICMR